MTTGVSFLRHAGWVDQSSFKDTIHIVGCGAVGSNLALILAKMGVTNFCLWDLDRVEPHNLPNQAYLPQHIGHKKTEALASVLKEFNPEIEITIHDEFFTEETTTDIEGVLVIAPDRDWETCLIR